MRGRRRGCWSYGSGRVGEALRSTVSQTHEARVRVPFDDLELGEEVEAEEAVDADSVGSPA